MSRNLCRSLLDWCKADRDRSIKAGVVTVLFLIGIGLFFWDYTKSVTAITSGIERADYGEGSREEKLRIEVHGESNEIEVEVSERLYTAEEIQQMFRRCISKLEIQMLGENENTDRIEKNLNLVTGLDGEPVEIKWKIDRYDVMNIHGELLKDLSEEGTIVNLQAVLTYTQERSQQALYECSVNVFPKTLTKEEKVKESVEKAIKKSDAATRTQEMLRLPTIVNGGKVNYYSVLDTKGLVVSAMAIIIGVLLVALEKQNKVEEQKKKKQQLMLDYPEIVNKLTLLIGAGMTIKRAWRKIAEDGRDRYVYAEMKITCREMDSGVTEAECYERFGKRCALQEYIRLGALLSQNLRKGTNGLGKMLKMETIQAFEERKARARRLGEEAGTKLLIPMFIMLVVVFVIVIVPAYLSMQI